MSSSAIARRVALLLSVSTLAAGAAGAQAPTDAPPPAAPATSTDPGAPASTFSQGSPTSQVVSPTQAEGIRPATGGIDDVVVTARKRQESILNVPVIATALPQVRIERLQINNTADLPKLVPGLVLQRTYLSIGTLVSIRGIGTTSEDPGVQQSVGLNIDGMSLSSGIAFNSGLFDLGQIEVLKGPQALFYGKSSPGGVISLRTADPTSTPEVVLRGAYEFESIQPRVEAIVSGPVSGTIKMRLAGTYYQQDGFFKNRSIVASGGGGAQPSRRVAKQRDYTVRLTTLWDPAQNFSARMKLNYNYDLLDRADLRQCASSPGGTAPLAGFPDFLGGGEDCRIDRIHRIVDLDTTAFPNAIHGGVPFTRLRQTYGTLELNYQPGGGITLSSTTAYYHLNETSQVNAGGATFVASYIGANNFFKNRNFSEELRANSDFSGAFNFTVGGLYQHDKLLDRVQITGNTAIPLPFNSGFLPGLLSDGLNPIYTTTYSVFGQARLKLTDQIELAGGARYTDEKRRQAPFNYLTNAPTVVPVDTIHPKRTTPEVSLTYKPQEDMTFFAAYKRGYKSGGFTISTPIIAGRNNSFNDEKVKGGEIGFKSRLFDRQLVVNIAAYDYRYSGLQVGAISPPSGGLPVIQTVNAASATVRGVDFDAAYRPAAVPGLSLNAAILYNHARYGRFDTAPCWGGQTIALGCNQQFNAVAGRFTAQDLTGTPLPRAPNWQGTAGFEYTLPLADDYKLTFTNSNQYSSRFVRALARNRPGNDNYQKSYARFDLGLTLRAPSDRWEVSLLGKNIANKIISSHCGIGLVKGGAIVANPSGTATPSPFGFDQAQCHVEPGREIWLRLTFRPFS